MAQVSKPKSDINKNEENKMSDIAEEIHKCVQIEGWLLKKSRVLKKWRKRWIVLSGNRIYTYKNQKEYTSEPTETIEISNILLIKKHENKNENKNVNNNQYSFEIELENKLIFVFAADSSTYRDVWIHELNKLINLNRECVITKDSLGKNGKILSYGCKHFRRNNSYLCSCCNKWYFCSYCHDSVESGFINGGHELERKCIVAMKCCFCGKEQKPTNECIKCSKKMANYYCQICKFWDNNINHKLFHCNKCGVCRSGNKSDYIHCDKCGVCLDKNFYKSHKCMEQSTKCDCPICGDYLHMSDKPVTFWPGCGHAIHVKCMEEFLVYDTLCPICREPWMP